MLEHGERQTYYSILGLHPSASAVEIRRAYWELSKRFHPDTSELASSLAKEEFQKINEAYATLSHPERRTAYDEKMRSLRRPHPPSVAEPQNQPYYSNSAYLEPIDRPLSAGEISALFMLCVTFIGCLFLAIIVGITRSDPAPLPVSLNPPAQIFPFLIN